MQTAISSPSNQQIASGVLSGLIYRESRAWQLRGTGSDVCPTNESALLYALNLNKFRLCDVDNIVVLGLRDLGTVEQQYANYAGQGPMTDQRLTQNGAIKQLGVAKIIQGHIRTYLRNGTPVNLHVCDENFTDRIKSILGGLGVAVIGWSDLPRYVNQHSLVYDLTMEGNWLQRAVNFSWQGDTTPPAAVITHRSNGINLVDKYWLSPLLESTPTLIVPEETFQGMASRPSLQSLYDQWVALQEEHSQDVQRGYVEEAAAHDRRMTEYEGHVENMIGQGQAPFLRMPMPTRSWVWDPMMIMLCRKDCPTPSEGKDEFEGEDESEGED